MSGKPHSVRVGFEGDWQEGWCDGVCVKSESLMNHNAYVTAVYHLSRDFCSSPHRTLLT